MADIEKNTKGETATLEKEEASIPLHVGIMMDGNRRWAKKQGLKIILGHKKGVDALEKTLRFLGKKGVKTLTVYAFSTENWKRGKEQVDDLLKVISEYLTKEADNLIKNNVVLRVIGDLAKFPKEIQENLNDVMKKTKDNTGIILNAALNYGGRDEIIRAVKKLVSSGEEIDEANLNSCLDTSGLPDPEIIIRTGGANRISNFLIWQSSYSEFFFTKTLWPDFGENEMEDILEEFSRRKRNFGA
ncbi:di-trans,poly-cis-decaprenylcistransferase [bacterium (Candidatus Howlettbacteria) CG_4_10_14_0_8_um_filter_40_9]|nr:MAG: di-trans,poly-cis-decaprenylcistransferase [bacterium (Candidatus Howlettbacteria) CG_4_10_14_0_8_um_filter_40_9]